MMRNTAGWLVGAALTAIPWSLPAIAQADGALTALRIGMVAHPAAGDRIDGAALIEKAFAEATGLPTQIFVARDYPALIEAQSRGRIDYGVYSAAAYAAARLACDCLEPIAAPIDVDGAAGIRAVRIERRDRTGASADVAAVPGDVTTWLAATPAAGGSDSVRFVDAATAFEAESMFLSGRTSGTLGWIPYRPDGAARGGGTLTRLVEAGASPDELEIVWQSEPLRFGPHAVRSDMPDALRDALTRFLASLHDAQPDVFQHLEPMRQGGFVPVSDAEYATARAMVIRIGETTGAR